MTILRPALAFLLIPLCQASTHLRHRRQSTLPGNWASLGCYTDNVDGRTLAGGELDSASMTTEACINYCSSNGWIYAGTEYADQCFCDNHIGNGGAPTATTDCNMACAGDSSESCGAGNRLNMYWSGQTPPPLPSVQPAIGDWVSLGCYSDNVDGRALPVGISANNNMSEEACISSCYNAGYPLAGTEYAAQCYCGNAVVNGGASIPASSCNMLCAGNSSEFCGGPNALNVFNYTGSTLPPNSGGGGGDTGGGGDAITSVYPVLSGLPGTWAYNACWVDNANGRDFLFEQPNNANLTVESCIGACASQNYTLAGMEYSTQCFCGDTLIDDAVEAPSTNCNMGCGGNTTEACGGPNALSVYSSTGNVTALPVPVALTQNLPGNWQYQGCLRELTNARVLPYEIDWPTNNTELACMNQCAAFGYSASGTEYGIQCFCGDISDVVSSGAVFGEESECALACPGDGSTLCGDGNRLTLYYWNGALNVWNTPENTGYYEFFMPGLVIPLISTVGINNKVTFLEKWGTGPPNSTGAYELDLSLVPDFSTAWRAMHVQSDVFCSGSIIMPDKGGRQINVGGWSLESTYGVRLYLPDGSPGVNGTNDWKEDYPALALQRSRWYPTASILANGTILVMGGEIGSNGPPQPNLETLPAPAGGDTTIYLDWLNRTDPYNLYPFIFILPSENVFVGYYNEARILEPAGFNTITTLPNIPGAVNDFTAGRTYPLAGASMLFPQYAPYTDPVTVVFCGGSTIGAGIALDNCVSIQPEVANPTWTLERMPSKRVMACMVALPDGTFMIMNGAQQGVAGFGLATDPNLSALLYDPSRPVGQRISILNTTIVARLYHSELALLPDGRVLISGSDPETYYPNGTEVYPQEYRIEVYVPPYLNQGFIQPTFTISETDWAYGGQYTISNIVLRQGTFDTLRISLISASSSTHGNTMGSRTIFPEFSCSGNSCTITAPPNAGVSPPAWHQLWILDGPTPSVAQWVRIGGDPSGLGNWPNLPGFTLPGV